MRWGRCLVSFDLEGDEPMWARPEVRRFIAAVHRSNPAFPVYLVMQPAFGMFHLWFGSLADPAALGDQGRFLNLNHPSVVNQLIHSISAIHTMMEELGFQSRPVLQALLTSYPRGLAERVLRAIGDPKSN